jgi:hypothetical protein
LLGGFDGEAEMGGWIALGEMTVILGGLVAVWYFLGRDER